MLFLKKIEEHRKTESNMNQNDGSHNRSLHNQTAEQPLPSRRSTGRSETQRAPKKEIAEPSSVDIKFMKYMDSTFYNQWIMVMKDIILVHRLWNRSSTDVFITLEKHPVGFQPIHFRTDLQLSLDSENTKSTCADSPTRIDQFDFTSTF
nr:unnamed protein product [Callosobruchus analis]